MWNFRNEMEDKWSYVNAYDKGWINQKNSDENEDNQGDLSLFDVLLQ